MPGGTARPQRSGLRIEPHRLDMEIRGLPLREAAGRGVRDRETGVGGRCLPKRPSGSAMPSRLGEALRGPAASLAKGPLPMNPGGRSHSPRGQEPQGLRTWFQRHKPVTLAADGWWPLAGEAGSAAPPEGQAETRTAHALRPAESRCTARRPLTGRTVSPPRDLP